MQTSIYGRLRNQIRLLRLGEDEDGIDDDWKNAVFSWVPFCQYFALNIVDSVPLEGWHRKPMDRTSVSIIKTLKNVYNCALINGKCRSTFFYLITMLLPGAYNDFLSFLFDSIWLDGSRRLEQKTPPCSDRED